MKPNRSLTLYGRGQAMFAAVRQFGRAVAGLPVETRITRPTIGDFTPFMWGGRRMTPDQVRQIIEGAVGGNLQQQWNLFDMMEDTWPRLVKNLNELKRAASRTTFTVQAYAERGEDPSDSAKERADTMEAALRNWRPRPGTLELSFEDAIYNALDAYSKGISVMEITWQRHMEGLLPRCAHLVPVTRYGWNAAGNELGLVAGANAPTFGAQNGDGATWQPFPPGQIWCGIWHARSGAPGQTALLRCLAPYWCGITFGWEWLLNNAQIFGVPLRWATYDSSRADLLPTLTEMLSNLGSAGWAAFPQGTDLQFKEAVQRATDNPQVFVQTMADKYCDQLILGQEASSESKPAGLGNGASDLHGSVRADRLQDAAQWAADLLNYQLVPAILRWNFGNEDEPPTIVPDLAAEPDPKAKAERDVALSGMGVKFPAKYLYERHGIPQPEEDEETIGGESMGGMPPFNFPPQGGDSSGLAAPGGLNLPETATDKSTQELENEAEGTKTAPQAAKSRLVNPPRSAVALHAALNRGRAGGRAVAPGAYEMDEATRRALIEAQRRDFAPLRKASGPLLAALEAGNLEILGEFEALIAKLDAMAPEVIGASALADVLEAALAEAAISGAVQSYGKLPNAKDPNAK
jgi:phage gp29-like protein